MKKKQGNKKNGSRVARLGDVLRQRDGERVVEQFPRVVPRREMTCVCVASGQQQGVFSPFGEPSRRDGRICLH